MRISLICTLFLSSLNLFAQEDDKPIPVYSFSFETGSNSRGIAGFGFDYNFKPHGNYYFNLNSSVGVGMYYSSGGWFGSIDPSLYLNISPSMNWGSNGKFFTTGVEAKYLYTEYEYSGFGFGGYIGGTFNTRSGFIFKLRGGLMQWANMPDDGPGADIIQESFNTKLLPTLGLSFGFGSRKVYGLKKQ
ncbi:MAG: hypothetical protein HRT57_13340 [Crocinitomicaceae bacterium]|nr:hypothetical protein [Crocinitomicaceae bacterium]